MSDNPCGEMVPRPDPEQAVRRALTALALAGFPQEYCLVAVAMPVEKEDGTFYETHIGATEDYDEAEMLNFMARELRKGTDQQAMATYGKESCPECGSNRYGLVQRGDGPMRIKVLGVCMGCGFEHPWPERA